MLATTPLPQPNSRAEATQALLLAVARLIEAAYEAACDAADEGEPIEAEAVVRPLSDALKLLRGAS